ncbi:MAG: type III pantothenate kinase [Sulfurovum sp.]|nr:type III pantothenate kinase [Sulfurovum sp.]
MMKGNLILADIGNTYVHIYDGKKVEHISHAEAIEKYKDISLYYISVKEQLSHNISQLKIWKNISSSLRLEGYYETMGVDRKALCLSHTSGIFIDAGSAITVDVVEKGEYKGGFILPGLKGYIQMYKKISPALDTYLDKSIDLDGLPFTTKEQISYGIIASIKALIEKHSDTKQLYFTGGDGAFLSTFFDGALYDETLVFQGMIKVIKE